MPRIAPEQLVVLVCEAARTQEVVDSISKSADWLSASKFFAAPGVQVYQSLLSEGVQPSGSNIVFDLAVPANCFEFDKPFPECIPGLLLAIPEGL